MHEIDKSVRQAHPDKFKINKQGTKSHNFKTISSVKVVKLVKFNSRTLFNPIIWLVSLVVSKRDNVLEKIIDTLLKFGLNFNKSIKSWTLLGSTDDDNKLFANLFGLFELNSNDLKSFNVQFGVEYLFTVSI
jgi:hypothetical protein